ncbi:dihydrolipoyl dehydrogenase, partial [candidate division KSB1 bacterium]|nr:dihydrolipoyl dehydrogenase [candidate division KSB1 bacterium]
MVVGDFTQSVETVVIGSGPGGYVAAIRAAQLGQEVVLVEKDLIGGICLNWGCIPSKAMIEVSGLKHHLSIANDMGLITKDVSVDMAKMHEWKDGVVSKLRKGVETLLSKNGVDVVRGSASFSEPGHLLVDTKEGLQRLKYKDVIIATGSRPIELPQMPFSDENIIDSNDAVSLQDVPERMLVVGAGSVGLELGMVYAKLGSEVTIIEMQENLLPWLEPEMARVLSKSLKKSGINLMLGSKVTDMKKLKDTAEVTYSNGDNEKNIQVDKILVAVGRHPNTEDIGLEELGLKTTDRGFIEVNEKMQTALEHVYAIGDLIAGPMLAHRASHMGKVAAEAISGEPAAFDNLGIPGVIFSDPEIS